MSATITTADRTSAAGTSGVSFGGVLRSEWLKLVTVRSTYWTTAISLVLAAGISLLLGAAVSADRVGNADVALLGITISVTFVALIVGVLGVLAIGGEYATLQIRSSYTAVPARLPALVAKGLVVAAWSFVLGLVVTFGGFGIVAGLFGAKGISVPFDGATVGALLGASSYLAIVGAFSVGVGAVVRSSAAGIAIVTGVLFVAPIVLAVLAGLLQAEWATNLEHFLLSAAGGDLFAVKGSATLELWAAVLTLACWIAAVWIPALLLTRARDV